MAKTKSKLKYHVIEGVNPRTKETINRPVIAERETLYIDQLVEFALKSGYVRGQFHDMRGALNGFIEAIQELGRNGKAVVLNDWLRIEGVLSGSVGADGTLTDQNEYRVKIRALKELKRKASDFSWTNVDGRKASAEAVSMILRAVQDGGADNMLKLEQSVPVTIHGTGLKLGEGDAVRIELYDAFGALADFGDCTAKVTASADDRIVLSGLAWNNARPDGEWMNVAPRTKLVVVKEGNRIELPVTFVD